MNIKKFNKTILTMMLGVLSLSLSLVGCGKDVSGGKFVALDTIAENVAYSDDGITWERKPLYQVAGEWWALCYANGKFVTISNGSKDVAFSTDGINWTLATLPAESSSIFSVCYGDGKFVAVGRNGSAVYSADAKIWTSGTGLPGDVDSWRSVCYGNGKFVAIAPAYAPGPPVSPTNAKVAYSIDGITWQEKTLPNDFKSAESVCYGKGRFVIIGNGGSAAYSADGKIWSSGTGLPDQQWNSVCYGNGRFVAVSCHNTAIEQGAYSDDGIHWTPVKIPLGEWSNVCFGDGKFIAVRLDATTAAYSTNGIDWAEIDMPGDSGGWVNISYGLDSDIFGFL